MAELDDILDSFALTPQLDVERSALQRRLSWKFLLPAAAVPRLAKALAAQYTLVPVADRRSATYRTLHFDTQCLDFYHAHRRGRRRCEKVRIRHYVDRGVSFFEVKQRFSELKTVKWRREHPFGDNELRQEDLAFMRLHSREHREIIPQAWTHFRRVTLINSRELERVTIDVDLRFANEMREISVPNAAVVEVKQPRFDRSTPIVFTLRRMGFRPRGFSKYCAAIVATHPGVRRNRIIPQLHALECLAHES